MENNREFTVLLVEDDLNDVFIVKRAFKKAQLQNPLQVVTDGQEAILYLRGEGKYADRQAYPLLLGFGMCQAGIGNGVADSQFEIFNIQFSIFNSPKLPLVRARWSALDG